MDTDRIRRVDQNREHHTLYQSTDESILYICDARLFPNVENYLFVFGMRVRGFENTIVRNRGSVWYFYCNCESVLTNC